MDVTVPEALVGRLLDGRYRVGHRLARGGMASVHEGLDTRLGRPVALKIMHPDLAEDHAFVERFIDEARHAARLSGHPNVVAVYDQGETDGLVWIAMELIHGQTLRAHLRERGRLSQSAALAVLEPVLSALAAAHRAGMVHRDVKPENILVGADDQVLVTDFGLARAVSSQSAQTRGVLLGTVAYIAPEQAVGEPATPASDVYSAGIVLSELLTGHAPHQGATDYIIVRKHVDEDVPPPSAEVPGIAGSVDELLRRATAREVAHRFPDGAAFLAALRRVRALVGDAATTVAAPVTSGAAGLESLDYAGVSAALALGSAGGAAGVAGVTDLTDGTDLANGSGAGPEAAINQVRLADGRDTSVLDTLTPATTHQPAARKQPAPTPDRGATTGELALPTSQPATRTSTPTQSRWRGLIAIVLVLALAAGAGWGAWWYTSGRFVQVPALTNMSPEDAAAKAALTGVQVTIAGEGFSETVEKGLVMATDPEQGARVLDGGTISLTVSKGPERFAVPKVVGLKRAAADDALSNVNLVAGKVTERYDDEIATGVVISQNIKTGEQVRRDTPVDLVVSKGREPVELTDWTGKSAADAAKALKKAELKVVRDNQFSDTVKSGIVISQTPEPGTVFKKDTVTLVVSRGPEFVEIPRVEDLSSTEAESILESAGFKTRLVRFLPGGPDNVLRQSPAEGGKARQGSTVTIFVF